MLCKLCDKLSITRLFELAEIEFHAHRLPKKAYFQHYASYAELVVSAQNGCELCELIYRGFRELVIRGGHWKMLTRDTAVQKEDFGSSTEIKVALNATYVGEARFLDVELFDELMVQVGEQDEAEAGLSNGHYIPPLKLALIVPRGTLRAMGNHKVGRYQLDPDLGSHTNFGIARAWLQTCVESHSNCRSQHVRRLSALPTRVIDVGSGEKESKICLVLSKGARYNYATLSHCWGGRVSAQLTTQNLLAFQDSIPFSTLPANFRDAITITRQLGLRYLWIDSLCIVQDSKEDWQLESGKMFSVYRDATVTIAASASRGSEDGLLRTNVGAAEDQLVKLSDGWLSAQLTTREPENLSRLSYAGPLARRGWALQEKVLSSRILHYGEEQIYWHCRHGFQSADGVPLIRDVTGTKFRELELLVNLSESKRLAVIKHKRGAIIHEYYELVSAYSNRAVSFDSDKLPAFASLAELIQPIFGGDYLAGIWSTDIHRGILWEKTGKTCVHVQEYRAPSWCWAATNEPITFYHLESRLLNTAEVISSKIELEHEASPYGHVKSGHLILRGLTMKLIRSEVLRKRTPKDVGKVNYDEHYSKGSIGGHFLVAEMTAGDETCLLSYWPYWPSSPSEQESETVENHATSESFLVLLVAAMSTPGYYDYKFRGGCLVLTELPENAGHYRRVGMFELLMKEDFTSAMSRWREQTVKII